MNRIKWMVCLFTGLLISSATVAQQEAEQDQQEIQQEIQQEVQQETVSPVQDLQLHQQTSGNQPLDAEMEQVKKDLVKLKRDLVILEEDLLFPASSQVSVFLSMDVGELFQLDAVTLKLNGKEVQHHLYTEKQVDALHRGGVQKLFVGNVKQGANRVTAFFTGRGPNDRDFRRATTVEFEKGFEPTFIELSISDETADYQPDFVAAVSD